MRRPYRRGEVKIAGQPAIQHIENPDRGGQGNKKSHKFVDVIYGSPQIVIALIHEEPFANRSLLRR